MADDFALTGQEPRYALEIKYHEGQPDEVIFRIVNDSVAHVVDGVDYMPFAFRAKPPSFVPNQIPKAELEVDNVGRPLMKWIEASNGGRGAFVRMMRLETVFPDKIEKDTKLASTVDWEIMLSAKISRATNEAVSIQLGAEYVLERPGVKIRHDVRRSPGLW